MYLWLYCALWELCLYTSIYEHVQYSIRVHSNTSSLLTLWVLLYLLDRRIRIFPEGRIWILPDGRIRISPDVRIWILPDGRIRILPDGRIRICTIKCKVITVASKYNTRAANTVYRNFFNLEYRYTTYRYSLCGKSIQ